LTHSAQGSDNAATATPRIQIALFIGAILDRAAVAGNDEIPLL
jgi:hypothetical protein